jgi:hypothetical protein
MENVASWMASAMVGVKTTDIGETSARRHANTAKEGVARTESVMPGVVHTTRVGETIVSQNANTAMEDVAKMDCVTPGDVPSVVGETGARLAVKKAARTVVSRVMEFATVSVHINCTDRAAH